MLQRAASNAYSWWWASHVRTKQSKWLEQSLQDMEEKVTQVLKLIEEDGDSFAKRAEMYYKKRPEIIHFVQETYRAYRGLAERYDLMSKELQKANSTLASAFPDQFQYAMDDDDHDSSSPGLPAKHMKNLKIPDVPKRFPAKKIRAVMALTSKNTDRDKASAGISKDQALEEIDKLQKAILTKQTEKEFTKSSYERGVARYWEIEQEITEMQENVSKLQYEFGIGKEIEDDEARTLMLEAAMKSCQDTLIHLQEKHVNSAAEAKEEGQKIKDARNRLLGEEENRQELGFEDGVGGGSAQAEEEEKPKTVSSGLSVSELADKIDELVNKVINLENAVSSQTAITQRLRGETDELLQSLDEQQHNKLVIETEEVKQPAADFIKDDQQQNKIEIETEEVKQHASDFLKDDQAQESTAAEKVHDSGSIVLASNECETLEKNEKQQQEVEEPNWQQLFVSGLEGKEKVLLNEYTSILRNYKQVKKKLSELENSKTTELRELQVENSNKDEEIQRLRQTLILLQKKRVAPESKNNVKDTLEDTSEPYQEEELEDDTVINLMMVEEERTVSPIEDKLRADIDVLLEENLDFWMRFSASFSQVQKFQNEIEDLHKELAKIERNKKDSSSSSTAESVGDARPIYKHLKEIQTELTLWLEKSTELKDELVCRFSQLCQIQEDITLALSDGAVDDEMKFTSFQAAKFQGEVLNMQQENKKVEDELQACVEHVTNLQTEVERSITKLNEELGISGSKSQVGQMGNRNRIPLRAFIFGVKPKKQKQSILSNAHPTWHKKYHSLKPGQS